MKTTKNLTKSAFLAAALAASVGILPAFAGSPITYRSVNGDDVEIHIDRTYFATDQGLAEVYDALKVEAKSSCEVVGDVFSVRANVQQEFCETKLLEQLVNSADSRALRKLHRKAADT